MVVCDDDDYGGGDGGHLHPGHAKEWEESEWDQIEQSWLSRFEHLQK